MRGHALSTSRKLNHHWQSAGEPEKYYDWFNSGTIEGHRYIFAPFYTANSIIGGYNFTYREGSIQAIDLKTLTYDADGFFIQDNIQTTISFGPYPLTDNTVKLHYWDITGPLYKEMSGDLYFLKPVLKLTALKVPDNTSPEDIDVLLTPHKVETEFPEGFVPDTPQINLPAQYFTGYITRMIGDEFTPTWDGYITKYDDGTPILTIFDDNVRQASWSVDTTVGQPISQLEPPLEFHGYGGGKLKSTSDTYALWFTTEKKVLQNQIYYDAGVCPNKIFDGIRDTNIWHYIYMVSVPRITTEVISL